MITIGSNELSGLYYGNNPISEVWCNGQNIWNSTPPEPEKWKGLRFVADSEGTFINLTKSGTPPDIDLVYSTDNGETWNDFIVGTTTVTLPNIGDEMCLRARTTNDSISTTSRTYFKFNSNNGSLRATGNINSLIDGENFEQVDTIPDYCYIYMFSGNTRLTQAPELPATTLASNCYTGMFNGCTSLGVAPELPATTLASNCYQNMFNGCTSLTTAPHILPATTLASNCYSNMFNGCKFLTEAPELPATTLAGGCYQNMFNGCSSLTESPTILPATTLASNCYQNMFNGCTSLTQAPELPATTLANYCCQFMFNGCTSLTQAPTILPATTLTGSCYTGMFQGCTSLEVAPELPATTVGSWSVTACYATMFYGCTSLKRIKMNASSGNWGAQMFYGCTSLELIDMTGSIGIPTLGVINNFTNTNDTYKIVVPDSLYDNWIVATNWVSIADHIMKQSDWNSTHPDDQL